MRDYAELLMPLLLSLVAALFIRHAVPAATCAAKDRQPRALTLPRQIAMRAITFSAYAIASAAIYAAAMLCLHDFSPLMMSYAYGFDARQLLFLPQRHADF